jgi:multidrug efflux pump subunit AcrA (membrane-fusion protein)
VLEGKGVEERPVQLGGFEGQVVEVLKGLKPGELVVVEKE